MTKRRIQLSAGILLLVTILLLSRLFVIQILGYDTYRDLAVQQREVPGFSRNQRGNIYDRNMIPLTGRSDETILLIEPALVKDSAVLTELILQYSSEEAEKVKKQIRESSLFSLSVTDAEPFEGLAGVHAVTIPKRYESGSSLAHVVGYANSDNEGMSGVESALDSMLRGDESLRVVKIADSKNNQIKGLNFKITGQEELPAVKLTLDYKIQNAVFDATAEMEKGAAVVADVESGDILAMVSRPNFDQNNVAKSITSENGELNNRALLSYNVGSVFKIVVASAAIEQSSNIINQKFECNGYIDVFGRKVACHKADGHGIQTFSQAFANSCNPAFIETGEKIGKSSIIEMAHKFGFGEKTDILPDSVEQSGVVTKEENNYPLDCANLSIGQGDLMATPLQVLSMVNTIANDGIKKPLNLLDCITDDAGTPGESLKKSGEERIIRASTAKLIQEMMRKTVTEGTGKTGESTLAGGVCAKTGSAQTGWMVRGETLVHAWYAGYFPADNPKYAAVVFVEGGDSGSATAGPIFQKIADSIARLEGKTEP